MNERQANRDVLLTLGLALAWFAIGRGLEILAGGVDLGPLALARGAAALMFLGLSGWILAEMEEEGRALPWSRAASAAFGAVLFFQAVTWLEHAHGIPQGPATGMQVALVLLGAAMLGGSTTAGLMAGKLAALCLPPLVAGPLGVVPVEQGSGLPLMAGCALGQLALALAVHRLGFRAAAAGFGFFAMIDAEIRLFFLAVVAPYLWAGPTATWVGIGALTLFVALPLALARAAVARGDRPLGALAAMGVGLLATPLLAMVGLGALAPLAGALGALGLALAHQLGRAGDEEGPPRAPALAFGVLLAAGGLLGCLLGTGVRDQRAGGVEVARIDRRGGSLPLVALVGRALRVPPDLPAGTRVDVHYTDPRGQPNGVVVFGSGTASPRGAPPPAGPRWTRPGWIVEDRDLHGNPRRGVIVPRVATRWVPHALREGSSPLPVGVGPRSCLTLPAGGASLPASGWLATVAPRP